MNSESVLNLVQTPRELDELYGSKDFYWYLRSPPFVDAFVKPMAEIINEIGLPCLDVGCGEAVLFDHLKVRYAGMDGSASAIERARKCRPLASIVSGRIESPESLLPSEFGTIVFGGLFSVLVKPECQVAFIERYAAFNPQFFIVYDLERTDTSRIDERFELVRSVHATAAMKLEPDVKRHRKIRLYRWS